MRYVSKILLTCGDLYVFSIKKSPQSPHKDRRMELFGGNADPGETPFQGLIRELQEEEESGILAKKAASLKLKPVKTFMIDEKMQCIYAMVLDEREMKVLRAHPDESYGIKTITKQFFDIEMTPIDLDGFTPKTVKIFHELGMIP